MWEALRKRFTSQPGNADASACDSCALKITPAKPGTVNPHKHHVLLRIEHSESASDGLWWPSIADSLPPIAAVTDSMKASQDAIGGAVKVTAFEYQSKHASQSPQQPGTCDVLIFPACVKLTAVAVDALPAAVLSVLTGNGVPAGINSEPLDGTNFIVCCHVARDARCGTFGPPLAAKLAEEMSAASMSSAANVFMSSHIGGHLYAGNVCVYSTEQATLNSSWFGGLTAEVAEAFVAALKAVPADGDVAADARLRKWWRGNAQLTKDEQVEHFKLCNGNCNGDIEDSMGP